VFQFHAGSIKRTPPCPTACSPADRFNSTLVRLKVCRELCVDVARQRFNSTLVRLKGWLCDCLSHNAGSIKRGYSRFNSTLVRLKGAIEGLQHSASLRFNSTLVRLKDKNRIEIDYEQEEFQFHAGSIKSRQKTQPSCPFKDVSIPRWFD
jgi:hypothetical protein